VGCKGEIFGPCDGRSTSFTLTMWDVKQTKREMNKNGRKCFTLTMWDVKVEAKRTPEIEGIKFYLNYVGCKAFSNDFSNCSSHCFTLTMWDVKNEFSILLDLPGNCFTLTMWDVKNKMIKKVLNNDTKFYLNYVGCKGLFEK